MNLLKPKDGFNPLFFQGSLAAGGLSLMPFNYLQFTVPHGKGLITFSDLIWRNFSSWELIVNGFSVMVMFAATLLHVMLTALFVVMLVRWLIPSDKAVTLINDPYKNVTTFAIIGSLSMSANVLWAPIGFFLPAVSSSLQALMLPSFILFLFLWLTALLLELKLIKVWLTSNVSPEKFNFVWVLDVFAFGLVSLTGSGLAITSTQPAIAGVSSVLTVISLIIGASLLLFKLVFLLAIQIKNGKLPENPIIPAFFLVVPIMCLYGLSFYRMTNLLGAFYNVNLSALSFIFITFSYLIAVLWIVFTVYIIWDYIKNHFIGSHYSAPQWGMV